MARKGKAKAPRIDEDRVAAYNDERDEVMASLIEAMKSGPDWVRTWFGGGANVSGVTGKAYTGRNRMHLEGITAMRGYEDRRWYTASAVDKHDGWTLKDGARPAYIARWKSFVGHKKLDEKDDDGNDVWRTFRYMRMVGAWEVYNGDEVDGLPPMERRPAVRVDDEAGAAADRLIATSRCPVDESKGSDRAYYAPGSDKIVVPNRERFVSNRAFLETLAHEMTHSTGPVLHRDMHGFFGTPSYAFEELVAELGACYLAGDLGFPVVGEGEEQFRDNHAAYLQSWLGALKDDPDYLYKAASKAGKAAYYIERRYNGDEDEGKADAA